MAFFHDGKVEYFSLNLTPAGATQAYVFTLSKSQASVARRLIPPLLFISIIVFMLSILMALLEYFSFTGRLLGQSNQKLLLIALSCVAAAAALLEIWLFMWVRHTQQPARSLLRRKCSDNLILARKLSWMAYLVFLLDMMVPFISLAALPGGLLPFVESAHDSGALAWSFLCQLAILLAGLAIFLTKRIFTIMAV